MTNERILELAYFGATETWAKWYDRKKQYPDAEIFKAKEEKAFEEMLEIEKLYKEAAKNDI